ncbi:histidine phosphatase family protein [Paenibacillus donghaensis]|uniref:histidine phosphatase family protein n=1 Tax=Paenibacillus donghaensis TaxID=414771 RepID=UPI001883C4B7|nr:histidine phosphatase family protein [Paenibacillus donghaensis]MBE9915116.1 histidine phosphatase family protein [Paenibacillus donghaensis]
MEQVIYLLRHGETELNTQGRYQGELDSSLTAEGIEQVKNNSRLLKLLINDPNEWKIISSPLGRAEQSAKIICEAIGYDWKKVTTDDRLREVSVGDWAGLTIKEIGDSWPELIKNTDNYNWYFNSPNGESYDSVVERVSDWLESIKNKEKVIAVSHGLTGRVLRGAYKNLEKDQALKLEVSQNTFFKLSGQNIQRYCLEFDEF